MSKLHLLAGLALAAAPPTAPAPPERAPVVSEVVIEAPRLPPPVSEVVVTARARSYARALTPKSPAFDHIIRWADPLCLAVIGLDPAYAAGVRGGLAAAADIAGLTIGKEGCAPNLIVALTHDLTGFIRQSTSRDWERAGFHREAVSISTLAVYSPESALANLRAPVLVRKEFGGKLMGGGSVGRIEPIKIYTFHRAMAVLDPKSLVGATPRQVGDFLAFTLLTSAEPDAGPDEPSAVNLFKPDARADGMTEWDKIYLDEYYKVSLYSDVNATLNRIVARIASARRNGTLAELARTAPDGRNGSAPAVARERSPLSDAAKPGAGPDALSTH